MSAEVTEWDELVPQLWGAVDCGEEYGWGLKDRAHTNLAARLLGDDRIETLRGDQRRKINRLVREIVGPHLRACDRVMAADLCVWIVKDWGGITRGAEDIRHWSDELGDYDSATVASFIARRGTARVASWSKLLAFAEPQTYAVYDARTAVALNCVLAGIGSKQSFEMPLGRNKDIQKAREALRRNARIAPTKGYGDYLVLLNSVVNAEMSRDVLSAEMHLFANAPSLARKFVAEAG